MELFLVSIANHSLCQYPHGQHQRPDDHIGPWAEWKSGYEELPLMLKL